MKIKERLISDESQITHSYLIDVPHLFVQNAKVSEYNSIVHHTLPGIKYEIKEQDSVIGANSVELRDKIMKQIPTDPRKTKQLVCSLQLAEGERTELAINVRIDDGLTNGASNVIRKIQLHDKNKPSGIVWVKFDHEDVGQKTRYENRSLYIEDIHLSWTPIKPITTQFAVGRTRSAQVVRKQFPLRPAAAKTIHRSQGDTENKIVVNFDTRKAIPHIHYVGLSRVTTIEGLFITNLCEGKITVSADVQTEMKRLRTNGRLKLSVSPLYTVTGCVFKLFLLNARSLHRHIDVRKDLNYSNTDLSLFSDTRFSHLDNENMYKINGYVLFRNDSQSTTVNSRPYGGTAVYSKVDFSPGYPYCQNINGMEITIIRLEKIDRVTIVSVYRSPKVTISNMCRALQQILMQLSTQYNIFIGDFNINYLVDSTLKRSLYNLFIRDHKYRQLVSCYTTDYRTAIDHIYTNLPESEINMQVLEAYFSDHKTICALINSF